MLINFAIGVVTGIVQEFQFGMNWSTYSRFVGDVFGAPLAMEALVAFFLESTFLGLWIFGWDGCRSRVHLATIWLVAIGTDALGLLHPRRQLVDAAPGRLRDRPATGRARADEHLRGADQLDACCTRSRTRSAAAVLTAGMLRGRRSRLAPAARSSDVEMFGRSIRIALPRGARGRRCVIAVVGHIQAQLMTKQQPMKMAAAEAL